MNTKTVSTKNKDLEKDRDTEILTQHLEELFPWWHLPFQKLKLKEDWLMPQSWRLERQELIEDKQEERARETLAWC